MLKAGVVSAARWARREACSARRVERVVVRAERWLVRRWEVVWVVMRVWARLRGGSD